MNKKIKCDNCGKENDFFALNCNNCKSYLRARVVNIDFWKTLWEMIEAPKEAFMKVIFAEHKNLADAKALEQRVKLNKNEKIYTILEEEE